MSKSEVKGIGLNSIFSVEFNRFGVRKKTFLLGYADDLNIIGIGKQSIVGNLNKLIEVSQELGRYVNK